MSLLKRRQKYRCAESGRRLSQNAEVDHKLPLFKVWREHRHMEWPRLLGFWGLPNLRVINRDAHAQKCAEEARDRREPVRGCPPPRPTVRDLLEALEAAQVTSAG